MNRTTETLIDIIAKIFSGILIIAIVYGILYTYTDGDIIGGIVGSILTIVIFIGELAAVLAVCGIIGYIWYGLVKLKEMIFPKTVKKNHRISPYEAMIRQEYEELMDPYFNSNGEDEDCI